MRRERMAWIDATRCSLISEIVMMDCPEQTFYTLQIQPSLSAALFYDLAQSDLLNDKLSQNYSTSCFIASYFLPS